MSNCLFLCSLGSELRENTACHINVVVCDEQSSDDLILREPLVCQGSHVLHVKVLVGSLHVAFLLVFRGHEGCDVIAQHAVRGGNIDTRGLHTTVVKEKPKSHLSQDKLRRNSLITIHISTLSDKCNAAM